MPGTKASTTKKQIRKAKPSTQQKSNPKSHNQPNENPLLLNIGHGNYIAMQKLIAVLSTNSSPIKRLVQEAKKNKTLKDATHGRRNRSVLIMENGDVILSALNTDTMALRFDHNQLP